MNSPELDADEIATAILGKYAKDDAVHKQVSDMALSEMTLRSLLRELTRRVESRDDFHEPTCNRTKYTPCDCEAGELLGRIKKEVK